MESEKRSSLLDQVRQWPTQPGVYIMRDLAGRIIYVGKAKNLRNRIRSYFQSPKELSPKTYLLVKRVDRVEFTVTNTELEALLLECNLIKKHRPRFNIRLKDDKNFPYIVLDYSYDFPSIRISRKIVTAPGLRYFGPYTGSIKDTVRFILKTFQIRDCSQTKFHNHSTRPCLNYEIGTCTAPCVGYVSKQQYMKQIDQVVLFLQGKNHQLLTELRRQMQDASRALEYEKAKILRDKISSVENISQRQDAIAAGENKNIDVIAKFVADTEIQWVVLFIRAGSLVGKRSEKTPIPVDENRILSSFIELFYSVSLIPDEAWVAEDFDSRKQLEQLLSEKAGRSFRIRPQRGDKSKRLLNMAYENARLIYEQDRRRQGVSATQSLQEVLGLAELPETIEGIDVSNLQGSAPAIALVHFAGERALKSRYRVYHPRTVEGQNDFAMIYETVLRRFQDKDNPPPDLLMIDGGRGQLASAQKALAELGVGVPVCALAKSRTQSAFTRKEVERSEERIFLPNRKNPIVLREGHPALRLLQQVRDEAHRFSVKSHRARRTKQAMQEGALSEIKGIGSVSRQKLLKRFGSADKIRHATDQDLHDLGLTQRQIYCLRQVLQ